MKMQLNACVQTAGGAGAHCLSRIALGCLLVANDMACGLSHGNQGVAKCVEEVGMGFMFAPRYHPAMKAVAPVRKALKIKTAFNILGPMLNPSRAPHSIVGVYHENLVRLTHFHYLVMKRPCLLYAHSLAAI